MHIHLPYLIFPWSFNEIRLVVSENSRGHEQYPIYSCRTHQRAITLGKIIEPEHAGDMRIHLWYLIFPWSFIEIRQAVSENLRGQERDGRTDARTHGRTDARTKRRLYAPPKFFGEHKKKGQVPGIFFYIFLKAFRVHFHFPSSKNKKIYFFSINQLTSFWYGQEREFVCVEVLWPSQPNGGMSSAVSLPNHTFTGQLSPPSG